MTCQRLLATYFDVRISGARTNSSSRFGQSFKVFNDGGARIGSVSPGAARGRMRRSRPRKTPLDQDGATRAVDDRDRASPYEGPGSVGVGSDNLLAINYGDVTIKIKIGPPLISGFRR
jgi:hypothetical protein